MRRIAYLAAAVLLLGVGACTSDDKKPEAAPSASAVSPSPSVQVSPTPPAGVDIKGPLNILIAGIDNRESIPNWIPRSDALMILHVNADLSKAYLTSLPRDLVVNVPAFPPAKFGGERTKLTHAMMYGSRVPGTKKPSVQQGYQLMAKTVSGYTGIPKFDGGAVLTFRGLTKLVDALGGIDVYVDQKVVSIHRQPDGKVRPGCSRCEHGYSGPRMTYNVGNMHMVGWQALDYARQRYTNGGDYTRQRHQRQIIEAAVGKILQGDFLSNPASIDKVVGALGEMLTVVGMQPVALAYALRNLTPQSITQVGLPGSGAYSGSRYIGENLSSGPQKSYFQALRQDKLDAWAAANKKYVNVGSPQG
ncbi:LCP family protein [Hamadaea sp. NPDC051192]|uniref:LCP family protein n=1 Tax=Hamadaea sp. NPDC051192 TaxID=3154940 RepID=UPI0034207838